MKDVYLVIDSSSGSVRAGVLTPQGDLLATKSRNIQNKKDALYPDALYFEPEILWQEIKEICSEVLLEVSSVNVMAVTAVSQREGIVLLDGERRALGGYPNIDNRGAEWEKTIQNPHYPYSIGGRWVSTLFSALKLKGVQARRQEIWHKIDAFTSISDWIGFCFTGRLAYETTQACETLLFDVARGEWSKELCGIFSIPYKWLPPVIHSGTLLGVIDGMLAGELGLKENTPFLVGGADTQMAIESCMPQEGDAVIVAGTTTPIVSLQSAYLVDGAERCWVNRHVRQDAFIVETNVGVSGLNYQRAKEIFYPDMDYDGMEKELLGCGGGRCTASVGSMIFSEGRITPGGGFLVNTPLEENLTRADFVWAVLMDYVCSFRSNFDNLRDITGREEKEIYGCGGGFLGHILPKLLADICQRPIQVVKGYAYGSMNGAVRMANTYFGLESNYREIAYTVKPDKGRNLEVQYEKWLRTRKLFNP